MQPEDIIQEKEWAQLNREERSLVALLAATEGEYNVLKKMLLIVQEETTEVPPVNPLVQQRLRTHLPKPPHTQRRTLWWAAAASLIALAVAVVFLLQPEKKPETAVQPAAPVQQKSSDSSSPSSPSSPLVVPSVDEPVVAKSDTLKSNKPKTRVVDHHAIDNSPAVAHISTSVAENESLLAFVIEAY